MYLNREQEKALLKWAECALVTDTEVLTAEELELAAQVAPFMKWRRSSGSGSPVVLQSPDGATTIQVSGLRWAEVTNQIEALLNG